MKSIYNLGLIGAVLLLLSNAAAASAPRAGEHISLSGDFDDDLYLAGGQVDLQGSVNGDVVVAGGQLNLESDVQADVIAAGGDIELRGAVADDVRIAGGNIRVLAGIGDDLVAAAGRLQLASSARVSGHAWLSAGDLYIDGRLDQGLNASGGRVFVSGTVAGASEIWAERIEIGPTAVILGDLHYHSPHPANIAEGARIEGEIKHSTVEVPVAPVVAGVLLAGLFIVISLLITAIALYLLFPRIAQDCSETVRQQPWASLGYGLAVFAAVPVLSVLLLSSGVGVLPGLLLLLVYLLMLVAGYIAGAYFIADMGLHKLKRSSAGKGLRALALAVSLFTLAILNVIPLLGSLLNGFVLLAGMGALHQRMLEAYRA